MPANFHFTTTFLVDQTPQEVFNAINNVRGWWSAELEGNSTQLNDVFEYRHKEFHYSKHRLTEVTPDKRIVWLTTDSSLSFTKDPDEWTGTSIIFDITQLGDKTQLLFTHEGLTPRVECYNDCSSGWTHYIHKSLYPLITTGKGEPDPVGTNAKSMK